MTAIGTTLMLTVCLLGCVVEDQEATSSDELATVDPEPEAPAVLDRAAASCFGLYEAKSTCTSLSSLTAAALRYCRANVYPFTSWVSVFSSHTCTGGTYTQINFRCCT